MDDQPRIFNLLAILSPSYWVSEILLQQQFLSEHSTIYTTVSQITPSLLQSSISPRDCQTSSLAASDVKF